MSKSTYLHTSDFVGIGSATLCTIHCLAAPFLLTLFHSAEWFHLATYVFLIISIYAAFKSSKSISDLFTKVLIWGGLLGLSITILLEEEFHWMHELSYLASFLLIIGHIRNIWNSHSCISTKSTKAA